MPSLVSASHCGPRRQVWLRGRHSRLSFGICSFVCTDIPWQLSCWTAQANGSYWFLVKIIASCRGRALRTERAVVHIQMRGQASEGQKHETRAHANEEVITSGHTQDVCRLERKQKQITSPDQRAHCMCTQALLMADTRTSRSGPSACLVTPSGVRVRRRCASRYSPASECCSWWHSTHLHHSKRCESRSGTKLSACAKPLTGASVPSSCAARLQGAFQNEKTSSQLSKLSIVNMIVCRT